jgi:hypothetical protein
LRQGSLSPTSLRYAVAAGTEGGGGAPFFAVLTGAFLAVFLAAGACWASAASALTLAQRLRLTSAMAFLPAALSFRYDAKKGSCPKSVAALEAL